MRKRDCASWIIVATFGAYGTKRRRQRAVIIRRRVSVSTRRRGRDISRRISSLLGMHSAIPFVTAPDCGRSSRSDKRMSTCFEYVAFNRCSCRADKLTTYCTIAYPTNTVLLWSMNAVCVISKQDHAFHEIAYEYSEMLWCSTVMNNTFVGKCDPYTTTVLLKL